MGVRGRAAETSASAFALLTFPCPRLTPASCSVSNQSVVSTTPTMHRMTIKINRHARAGSEQLRHDLAAARPEKNPRTCRGIRGEQVQGKNPNTSYIGRYATHKVPSRSTFFQLLRRSNRESMHGYSSVSKHTKLPLKNPIVTETNRRLVAHCQISRRIVTYKQHQIRPRRRAQQAPPTCRSVCFCASLPPNLRPQRGRFS